MYDTQLWTPRALELKDIINDRVSSDYFLDLQDQVDDAWNYFRSLSGYERSQVLNQVAKPLTDKVNAYRDETAKYALELGQERPLEQYTGKTIGDLVLVGDYTGSENIARWLAARKLRGFGGSDIGDVLGYTSGKFAKSPEEVVDEKATLDLDFEDTLANIESKNNSHSGPFGRGNAWEPVIAGMFQRSRKDEMKVLEAKGTFRSEKHQWQTLNVDGLLCSDGVTPDMILEVKTSSLQWNGVIPVGYRCQLLNYLNGAGFYQGYFAVLIGDNQYEEYEITADEPISGVPGDETFLEAISRIDGLWEMVLKERRRRYGRNWEEYAEGMVDRFEEKYQEYLAAKEEGSDRVAEAPVPSPARRSRASKSSASPRRTATPRRGASTRRAGERREPAKSASERPVRAQGRRSAHKASLSDMPTVSSRRRRL